MNTKDENLSDKETSGYTGDIQQEMDTVAPLPSENGFSSVRECYVSTSGHTRLFTAMRYGKLYVLKGIKPDFLFIPVYRQALTKEFEIGLQLDHPNICRTIGMEEVGDLGSVIVMEHIDGETLQTMMASGTLDGETAWRIARQLADALDYIHSKQIVHRDLKPSNIMITHNGHNVKLIDFSLSDSDSFAVLKQPAGTYGYIAPELFMPNAKSDISSDIYSFGMVVKEMADVTADKKLARIAEVCTRRNPASRPSNKQQIFDSVRTSFRQRLLLFGLLILSALLAIYIVVTIYQRTHLSPDIEQGKGGNVGGEENTVRDIYTWPAKSPTDGSVP